MEEEEKEKIREIMKEAEECSEWIIAIMIATLLDDRKSANKFVDKLAGNLQWDIPLVERTKERIKLERQKIWNNFWTKRRRE